MVVIMFELTGALTYILPTMVCFQSVEYCRRLYSYAQIVLLVTKAVGDFLGTNGIADEMIRFNGFPFLEKEEHSFNVAGTNNDFNLLLHFLISFFSIKRDEDRSTDLVCIGNVC